MTAAEDSGSGIQRLLIVDDEVELRSLLAMKFTKSGFAVDLAANGTEAIEFINTSTYSAILCDLNLSETLKGGDLHKFILAKRMSSKFIAITGYAQDSPEVKAARAEGMKYVFSKPLQMKAILSLIQDSN
jgi:DNA-binding NtrC family response regulator